jgi:hypothetical protein
LFFNFDKNMKELWLSDTFWRFLINSIGALSIFFGSWLLYRLIKFIYNSTRNKTLNDENYINLMNLPDTFKNQVQIGLILKNTHKIDFNILDLNENILLNIYNGELPIGDKIFIVDSLKLKNGEYYFSIKTIHQNIFRKIIVSN